MQKCDDCLPGFLCDGGVLVRNSTTLNSFEISCPIDYSAGRLIKS